MCSVHRTQVVSIQNWHVKNGIAGALTSAVSVSKLGFSELSQLTLPLPLGSH